MFIDKKICFIEMEKTACTFLREELKKDFPNGHLTIKHDRPDKSIENSNRLFIGSIRNPYEWYVSTWSFGCKVLNNDPVYSELTSRRFNIFKKNKNLGIKNKFIKFIKQFSKDVNNWKKLYSDPYDTKLFQEWLFMILDGKKKYDLLGLYGYSPMSPFIGYMSFVYIWTFMKPSNSQDIMSIKFNNFEEIEKFNFENNLINFFIKVENINDDYNKLLKKLNEKTKIISKDRINVSTKLNYDDYHNANTKELINLKDKIIFKQHY